MSVIDFKTRKPLIEYEDIDIEEYDISALSDKMGGLIYNKDEFYELPDPVIALSALMLAHKLFMYCNDENKMESIDFLEFAYLMHETWEAGQ